VVAHAGGLAGAEAVVDKDLCAALLAGALGADALLLLTDVAAVYADWPERRQPIAHTSPAGLRALELAAGSMGPKAEAACRFAERGGFAAIGSLADASRLLAGSAGTCLGETP
jgi:carbamate kinase